MTPICMIFSSLVASRLLFLSKVIENKFWSDVLHLAASLVKESTIFSPESFYLLPIWNNPLFKNGKKVFYSPNTSVGHHKLQIVADLYSSPRVPLSLDKLSEKYNLKISPLLLSKLHNAITDAENNLNYNLDHVHWHEEPRQSIIIQIASKKRKGCQAFYKVFRAKQNGGAP